MEETEIEVLVPAEDTAHQADVTTPTGLAKARFRETLFDLDNIRGTNLEILIASGKIDELSIFRYVGFDEEAVAVDSAYASSQSQSETKDDLGEG